MSVDTVNIALSKVRRDVLNYPENFSESGYRKVLACLECMRDSLMKGHIDDFDRYVDGLLSREPDTADYILDDLFQQLGIQHRTQLSNILAQE